MTDEGPERAIVAQTRRRFVQALSSAGVGAAVSSAGAAADRRPTDVDSNIEEIEGTVGGLSFYSPASQLNASKEPLADDDVALVRAEPTAFNFETTEDGPEFAPVLYGEDDPAIPLVSQDTDDPVVGFGTIDFVKDTTGGFRNDNEMFMLNLFDELMGPGSVVAFDESHQFFQGLDDYQAFSAYAQNAGYDIQATDNLLTSGGLTLPSTASQVDETGEAPLVDDDHIVVWAEPTAENIDNQGDDAVDYPGDTDIPLVSRDGNVVGFGTPQLLADEELTANNEQFLLNLLEDTIGGSGTVVWDDAHDTFWDSSKFGEVASAVGEEDYELLSSGDDILTSGQPKMEFASTSSLLDESDEGGLLFTAETQPVVWAAETATNLAVSGLVVDDVTTGVTTTHAWVFENVDFQGEVDTITVDYPDSASLDGLTDEDIEVVLRRELSSGPDTSYIGVNSGDYTGSGATFDLSGFATTNIAGPVSVRIDGITNPDTTDYEATVTFEGADDTETLTESPTLDGDDNPKGSTDTVPYPGSVDIPLVGVDEDTTDGAILGVGADLVSDGSEANNRTVLLNAWEDLLPENATVLYDETHGQNRTLSDDYTTLESEAENRGFSVSAIAEGEDFAGALDGADAVMIAGDDDGLTEFAQAELDALSTFLSNGGGLFVHDTSYVGGDPTEVLNSVFAAVGATFRFNVDQVVDEENSGSEPSIPRTDNYNSDTYPSYFEGLGDPTGGIDSADVVAIPSPSTAYTQAELDALSTFTASGGTVLLFDQSDFEGNDETGNLNAIAEELSLAFRFNADQVEDTENNVGVPFVPTTMNFNEAFDLFDGFEGIGLSEADGVIVTTPNLSFFDSELDALSSFVDSGGAVFLFDQSDFGGQGEEEEGFDETANLNAVADALGLDFRFNSDQVNDEVNNTGSVFDPLTANYDVDPENPGVFAERDDGIGIDFNQDQEYYGQVVEVADGDTFVVEFDEQHTDYGYRDTVRHLGMDTAETGNTENDPFEWFGIPDDQTSHLDTWGNNATTFALDLMAPEGAEAGSEIAGRSVKIRFDDAEPVRGGFGRILSYMDYDPDNFAADPETGNFDAEYNIQTVEEGYARVYSSGFGRHDEFGAAEETALANNTGVWQEADFDALTEYRTGFAENAFLPRASSVTTTSGPLDGGDDGDGETGPTSILRAGEGATQEPLGEGGYDEYEGAPALAGVDFDSGVAMFGGQLLEESYEAGEDDDITDQFDLNTAGNFTLFTNTLEMLSANNGPILIEGGHGQFGVDGGATLEDLKFYLRHVEGLSGQIEGNARLRQINNVENSLPDDARALVLTTPGREYTDAEVNALSQFSDAGGAVVLVGSAAPDPESRGYLNQLAADLGTDLRLNDDQVLDESELTDAELLVTENVEDADGLLAPVHLDRSFDGTGVMAALNNEGNNAWLLEAATDGVELTEESNPRMMFKIGERHHIENRGGAETYPLAFRDEDGTPLLSQDGEGTLEGDDGINWVDTGDVVEFTLTEKLAERLDSYICPVAESMKGSVVASPRLGGPPQITAQYDGPPRDLDGDGLFEDIDGDGEFDIFDVQALFDNLENDTVQEYGRFFDFNEDGPATTIFDVQALFNRL